jgi:hypothetical protein
MARGRDHTCDFKYRVVLEHDKTNYESMMKAVASDCHGNYIRVIMVNPILAGMPKLVMMVQCTCNKFTHADVKEQWDLVEAAFHRTLRDQCGMFPVGNASDGDERRFKLQKKDCLVENIKEELYKLPHAAVTMGSRSYQYSHPKWTSGKNKMLVRHIHCQDPRHKAKLLYGTMVSRPIRKS